MSACAGILRAACMVKNLCWQISDIFESILWSYFPPYSFQSPKDYKCINGIDHIVLLIVWWGYIEWRVPSSRQYMYIWLFKSRHFQYPFEFTFTPSPSNFLKPTNIEGKRITVSLSRHFIAKLTSCWHSYWRRFQLQYSQPGHLISSCTPWTCHLRFGILSRSRKQRQLNWVDVALLLEGRLTWM